MKKTNILFIPFAATIFCACSSTSPNSYLGMMAGAEIGGTLGEAIGLMSTNRHDGPGKAMLGSVIGTVAGAAIGYEIASNADEANAAKRRTSSTAYADATYDASDVAATTTQPLTITNITYQDEDGDGKFARYETINVIYEITNNTRQSLSVCLAIDAPNHADNLACSPNTDTTIEPEKTIRYKAKAFLKDKPSAGSVDIRVAATANGYTTSSLIAIPIAP